MSTTEKTHRFVSPYDDPAPAGAEGWEDLYPYYVRFREDRREFEESRFWFADTQHWPTVFKPFDAISVEFAVKGLGQYNTRHLLVPPANGIDYRFHNGYIYMSPVPVPEEEVPARVPQFLQRAGHYYANWDSLLENWKQKIGRTIDELAAISFHPLPDVVAWEDIESGVGLDPSTDLIRDYDRLIQLCYEAFQYHFEFLNLGYVAYLDFFTFCKEALPGVADLGIAKMVQGIDVILFRPDDELRRLARRAVELDLDGALGEGDAEAVLAAVAALPGGAEWLEDWEATKLPWFNFSSGSGMYSGDKVWLDHLEIPLGHVREYARRLREGADITRPTEALRAERDRITAEYRDLLPDDAARAAFDEKLGLSRRVFPYVEEHNFYIEHQSLSNFWRKVRELGAVLAGAGFWEDSDDIFYLRRDEIPQVLFDYANGWAIGVEPMGPYYWPAEIARRKQILAALSSKPPTPAMNEPPAVVTEPFTIMLYGITSDSVERWLQAGEGPTDTLTGMAASPGIVEGVARVVSGSDDLDALKDGEILVARITAPSWGPVFGRIAATVTDIGGIMSHAAIICREYGLPAVTGANSATTKIETGQRIRVDGNNGTVTLLDSTMSRPDDHDPVWRAALPYMRARKNDIHVPMAYDYALRLVDSHPEADREIVLLAILLHDCGWAVVDQDKAISEGFGGGDLAKAMASDIRIAHEKEGARIAREILGSLGYDAVLIERVAEIIDGHDTRKEAISREDRLVKDADALWRWSLTGASISADWWGETPALYADRVAPMIDVWLGTDEARQIARAEFSETVRVFRVDVLREPIGDPVA